VDATPSRNNNAKHLAIKRRLSVTCGQLKADESDYIALLAPETAVEKLV